MTYAEAESLRKKDIVSDNLGNQYVLLEKLRKHTDRSGDFYTFMASIKGTGTKICVSISSGDLKNYGFTKHRK